MAYRDVSNAIKVLRQAGNLPAELAYLGLTDGVVFTRENTMTFGINLQLVSAARATPDVRIETRDRMAAIAQSVLPVGTTVKFYLETRPATQASLEHFAPARKDGSPLERILQANHAVYERMRATKWISETHAYMTFTLQLKGRPKHTTFLNGAERPYVDAALALRGRLVRQLAVGGLHARPMTSEDVWARIYDYFNPSTVSSAKPPYQSEFDQRDFAGVQHGRLFGRKPGVKTLQVASMRAQAARSAIDLDHDGCFMLGGHRVGIVSFLRPRGSSRPGDAEGIITALGGTHSTFMTEFLVVDAPKTRAELNESLDKQETAAGDPSMKAGREIYGRLTEGNAVLQQVELGNSLTEMSLHAAIFARTQEELDERVERTLSAFSAVGGCMPVVANAEAISLFLENAPFHGKRSSYQTAAYVLNAADCMPQVGAWPGRGPSVLTLRARNGNLIGLSPVGLQNAGIVVTGKSGGGKSVAMNLLASGLVHAYDASLTVVDPKDDYRPSFQALGAGRSIISISPGATLPNGERVVINPFDLPTGMNSPGPEKLDYLMEFFRALRVHDGSGLRRSILTDALRVFYMRASDVQETPDGPVYLYRNTGVLSDFVQVVRTLNTIGGEPVQGNVRYASELRDVAQELQAFTGRTHLGLLLDGLTTVDVQARHLYLNIRGMMGSEQTKQLGVLLVQELVWNRLLTLPGKKVVVMEEAGVAKDLPGIVTLTDRIFKLTRSFGVIPILVTQEVGDTVPYKGVINNATTRILFPSAPGERAAVAQIYNLNPAMQALHASLGGEDGRYRELLVLQDSTSGVMDGDVGQLWLSREAYWMTTSVKEEVEQRMALAAEQFGGDQALAALHLAQLEQRPVTA